MLLVSYLMVACQFCKATARQTLVAATKLPGVWWPLGGIRLEWRGRGLFLLNLVQAQDGGGGGGAKVFPKYPHNTSTHTHSRWAAP